LKGNGKKGPFKKETRIIEIKDIGGTLEQSGYRHNNIDGLDSKMIMMKGQTNVKKDLPISPMKLKGEIANVPISAIKVSLEKSIEFNDAVVAYLDILGFSKKKDDEDIKLCLLDFSGPLIVASREFNSVRFNIFSDCAFVSSSQNNADHLLSALRFAFRQWISDGILVRGGIAKGTYCEMSSAAQKIASNNTISSIFSGSAVFTAVKLEGSGNGALLFTNDECARFYNKNYGEPIYSLEDQKIISWSDNKDVLFCFAALSFLRLLKIISTLVESEIPKSICNKLMNNIKYSRAASSDIYFPWLIISPILSSPIVSKELRGKILELFNTKEENIYEFDKKIINKWFDRDDIKLLFAIADMDSSIPPSTILSDILTYKYEC